MPGPRGGIPTFFVTPPTVFTTPEPPPGGREPVGETRTGREAATPPTAGRFPVSSSVEGEEPATPPTTGKFPVSSLVEGRDPIPPLIESLCVTPLTMDPTSGAPGTEGTATGRLSKRPVTADAGSPNLQQRRRCWGWIQRRGRRSGDSGQEACW
ncbi:hypothetical protein BCR34DRAFT_586331 [Clohesyomyces aquaticus]|uniref:Uncharacterized protein n=1 Tax=Clohesyomyces aquaticus TaxID=1231657 RepID=A0A1Y1ZU32_9PLEO|nr:hypothetical protein BCR34DRAFT_586331 [Clohesyomyces aquaticus]